MTSLTPFAKFLTAIIFALSLAACGDHSNHNMKTGAQITAGDLTISSSWARAVDAPAKTSAVYMEIRNDGATSDTLLSVRSGAAEVSEIHQSLEQDGVAMMRRIRQLEIPAGGDVSLEPGSYHVMLINVNGDIAPDTVVPVTLTFENAGDVVVEAVARRANGGHQGH
ncbi:MAG: copper chaperone PCu(A)C [Aquisalinus sp.]|nr:copper chaperone PCu(A)C [Aquisalinus sp.]